MYMAMVVAGVALAPAIQPRSAPVRLNASRPLQWFAVPGGAIVPVSFPFTLYLPWPTKFDAEMPSNIEFSIVFDSSFGKTKQSVSKALVEKYRDLMVESTCDRTKTDPKQVLDPVVTGF